MKFFEWNFIDKSFKWNFVNKSFKCNFLIERSNIKMSEYFPKPFRSFWGNINVKVNFSDYATKADLKNGTHVDASIFVH